MAKVTATMKLPLVLTIVSVFASGASAADTNTASNAEAAYTHTLTKRVESIVEKLGIEDSAKSNRVHAIIVRQYRDLRDVHDPRDARIKAAKSQTGADKDEITAAVKSAQEEARVKLDVLHTNYLTRLSAELSSTQIDKVKDGMTYGVLPLTYGVYLRMYPELTDEQKRKIKDWLTEARELAMDGSTSNEKHAVFGKYKGRINNYLSAAGYDAKKAEQNLRKSQPAAETKSK